MPKRQIERLYRFPDGQPRNTLQLGVRIHALLKPVVRDLRIQVMHVMDSDVRRDPLQHFWQYEIRAAAQASVDATPLLVPPPVRILELVLYVEHPHP